MSLLHRTAEPMPASGPPAPAEAVTPSTGPAPVLPTRASALWVGVCAAALIAVPLIVFLAQNTSSIEIHFLWMTASTPLTVALLIATVGGTLLTLVLGTARITQLRRRARGRANDANLVRSHDDR